MDEAELLALAEKRGAMWSESFAEMRGYLLSLPHRSVHKDKLLRMLRDKIEKGEAV